MAGMRWIWLLTWLALCFAVAGVSGSWTASEIPGWYRTLTRPSISPPSWLFGPVWTLLYAMMAIAAWQVSQTSPSTLRTWAIGLFLTQLALNFAWSFLFFRCHAIGGALAEVIVLWLAIGATTLVFGRVMPSAAGLMVPYWAWVTFAAVLNAAFWRLN
jgi:tryptophan-rich sensory protein